MLVSIEESMDEARVLARFPVSRELLPRRPQLVANLDV